MNRHPRHRRQQRWVAFWAVLALLLNQAATASHLCLPDASEDFTAVVQHSSRNTHVHPRAAETTSDAAHAPGHCSNAIDPAEGKIACAVHCAHSADGNQQGKVPAIAPPAASGPVFTDAALLASAEVAIADSAPSHRRADQRRLYEFCSWLI